MLAIVIMKLNLNFVNLDAEYNSSKYENNFGLCVLVLLEDYLNSIEIC